MFNYGNSSYDLLWNGVSGEHEAVQKQATFVHSKVAVAQYWPFLSRATSEQDFENRLSLTLDRIEARVQPGTLEDVLSSLREDFRTLAGAKGENPFAKSDDDDDKDDDKDDKKSENPFAEKKEDESSDEDDDDSDDDDDDDSDDKSDDDDSDDDDDDDDDKPAFLKKKESSYKDISDKGCPDCGAKWKGDKLQHKANCPTLKEFDPFHEKSEKKHATNYQPDPNAAWRYHPGYEQLRAPVNNGDLQDGDGFVTDLAQGEDRSNQVIEERQLTPGTWTAHDGMPERPMPQGVQRGYQPVASNQGAVCTDGNCKQAHWAGPDGKRYGSASEHPGRTQVDTHRLPITASFDSQGFLIEAAPQVKVAGYDAEGFLVEALVDPAPGTPQRHNPFYFQEGSSVGGNEGFPVNPGEEPKPNNLEEFYGEVSPTTSSGESTQGTTDGQGYSRLSSLQYDAQGFLVESPNFI